MTLDVALSLAAAGLHVFPCMATGEQQKRPHPRVYWRRESTTHPNAVRAFWHRFPDSAPALDLAKCGLLVIDCDRKPGKPDGLAAFLELAAANDADLSRVPAVNTPSGGRHYYFRQSFNPPHGNGRGVLPPGIDVRGNGGFTLGPGAVIEAGPYVPENDLDLADAPEVPDWLAAYLRPAAPAPTPTPTPTSTPRPSEGRVEGYGNAALDDECRKLASAGPGTRNESANTAAFRMGQLVGGGVITEGEAISALENACRAWGVPSSDKVFGRHGTIARGVRAGMANPRTVPDDGPAPREVVSVDGILADAETGEIIDDPATEPAEPRDGLDLPADLLDVPGLVGEIAEWIVASARRPQASLALGAALTIVGTAAGRHIAGPTGTGTHLYVMGLAKSGFGKDHPLQAINRILSAAMMTHHIGPSEFMSLSAVVHMLTRKPLAVCPMDEFGAFLSRINNRKASSHEQGISKILRTVWGLNFAPYNTPEWAAGESKVIQCPALSIYGTSTPEEFYSSLSGADITNGTLNRFLVITATRKPIERQPTADPTIVPDSIIAGLRAIYFRVDEIHAGFLNRSEEAPEVHRMSWRPPEAESVYRDLVRQVEAHCEADPATAPFYARTAEIALRMASIRGIGLDPDNPTVDAESMQWAARLAMHSSAALAKAAGEHMVANDFQASHKLVLRLITEAGRIKRNDLVRKLDGRIRKQEFDGVVSLLVESGTVDELKEKAEGAGRPATFYQARS